MTPVKMRASDPAEVLRRKDEFEALHFVCPKLTNGTARKVLSFFKTRPLEKTAVNRRSHWCASTK